MKYVMLDGHIPIIFPEILCHLSFREIEGHTVTSAGTVVIEQGRVRTADGSTSLGMFPKENDSFYLTLLIEGIYNSIIEIAKSDLDDAKYFYRTIKGQAFLP
jgi:hypothetical protein